MAAPTTPVPTHDELESISLAANKLWKLDDNQCDPQEDYAINVQRGKSMFTRGDTASEKLFKGVKKEVWQKPTFLIFYNLLDNYAPETGTAEVETQVEKKEQSDFLDACLKTRVMQYCHKYCVAKGQAGASVADFKRQLYQMWFSMYRRDGQNDSCGFEHVFVGESKGDSISGFHNWVQFYIEEQRGNVDYLGYVLPKARGGDRTDDTDRLLSVQFSWKGEEKSVSTFFVGTSPEFELALYTMVFLCGDGDKTFVELGHYDLNIVCYRISSKYGDKVATAYPDLIGEDPANALAKITLEDET